jgi:hypothetical protein
VIPEGVHRSPGIYLTAEENPGKPQLGEGCATSHCLNWVCLLSNCVGMIEQHFREEEERTKEMMGTQEVEMEVLIEENKAGVATVRISN